MKNLLRFGLILASLIFVLGSGCGREEKSQAQAVKKTAVKKVIIVTGADHPAHNWRQTAPALADVLRRDKRLVVTAVDDPNFLALPKLREYDVVVLHFMKWEQPTPGQKERENLQKFVQDGKGLFILHFGSGSFYDWPEFRNLAGRVWDPKLPAHDPKGPFHVNIIDTEHAITKGLQSFDTDDELYTCLAGERPITLLATARAKVDGKDHPMAFVFNYGKGRVFHTALGHDVAAITNSNVAELFRRGCAWAAGLPPVPSAKINFFPQ